MYKRLDFSCPAGDLGIFILVHKPKILAPGTAELILLQPNRG
jgi:hypothetical protein